MKKIEAWKTTDGKVWETESAATKHQKEIDAIKYFDVVSYRRMIECGDDVVNFLIYYKDKILEYYGIENASKI